MRLLLCAIFGIGLVIVGSAQTKDEGPGIWDCLFQDNSATCARKILSSELDQMEVQVTGRSHRVPISGVIEQTGRLVAEGINKLIRHNDDEEEEYEDEEVEDVQDVDDNRHGNVPTEEFPEYEAPRRKKFGKKKKKKHLHKMMMIGMMMKAKLSLLLQMLSSHFQIKFFVIAVVNLLINIARFYMDLKKGTPTKIVYYDHGGGHHHYDRDEDHGGWGRSTFDPQDVAYNAYSGYSTQNAQIYRR